MGKPQNGSSNLRSVNRVSDRGKTAKGTIGENQRTLFQCWKKKENFSFQSADGIEVVELEETKESQSAVLSTESEIGQSATNHQVPPKSASNFTKKWTGNLANGGRHCPFYKRVADAPYVVDAFNYTDEDQIKGYFLSHFHSDHYAGLGSRFLKPVYCSEVTAKLAQSKLKVPKKVIVTLSLDQWTDLPDGTRVYLIDANHCPGAVIFVFQLRNGRLVMHTGDMRADDAVLRSIRGLLRNLPRVDTVHLDTTYCDQIYSFPSQSEIIHDLIGRVQAEMRQKSRLLIVIGAYQIGKEKVFQAISEALDLKIFVQKEKWDVLACLNDSVLMDRLTLHPNETPLHVVGMGSLSSATLSEYLRGFGSSYDSILGISATGWEFKRKGASWRMTRHGNVTVIGAPYSEHSSYSDLKRFVQLVRPRKVIPTVNVGNASTRKKMQEIIDQWIKEDDLFMPKEYYAF